MSSLLSYKSFSLLHMSLPPSPSPHSVKVCWSSASGSAMFPLYQPPKTRTSRPTTQYPLSSGLSVSSRPVSILSHESRIPQSHFVPQPRLQTGTCREPSCFNIQPLRFLSYPTASMSGPHHGGLRFCNTLLREPHCPCWPAACTAHG